MLLWALENQLAEETKASLEGAFQPVFVSAASAWEIEIKRALGKLKAPSDIAGLSDRSGFERLLVTFEHAREIQQLPLHHGDPFDRMLVAQARVEGLTLATSDSSLAAYEVPIFDVERA